MRFTKEQYDNMTCREYASHIHEYNKQLLSSVRRDMDTLYYDADGRLRNENWTYAFTVADANSDMLIKDRFKFGSHDVPNFRTVEELIEDIRSGRERGIGYDEKTDHLIF